MRDERLGSYSMLATFAGIESLSRLKSITLYILLCPPPRCLTVNLPWAFLPPVLFIGWMSAFSGSVFVISSKPATVTKRRPGDVGLNFLIATGVHLLHLRLIFPQRFLSYHLFSR